MRASRLALAPWWLLQLATGAKAFSGNPLIGSPALNRHGLHALRVRAAGAMARWRRARLARRLSPDDRIAFDRDGYVERRDFLPADLFAELREQVLGYAGPAREMVQGDTVTRRFALEAEAVAAIPAARALLDHPAWRGLVRYAGTRDAEPLVYIQSILPCAQDAPRDPQTDLHADTFHATVKAWFFLVDVALDEGPFRYVPGSHRNTPERIAWERRRSLTAREDPDGLSRRGSLRIGEEELASLGLPEPRTFAVPANTLVVADTHGFHARGLSARPSVRVEIWAYGRTNPFVPWTGFDLTSLPVLRDRRIGWMWRARDRYARFFGQPWRDVGVKRPGDPA